MAQSSVMLSVPQLVDLALNSPEMGVINFNMLHALLHVLVQQSDLGACTVEFRGDNGEKVQSLLNSMKPAQAVTVTEYIVNKEGGKTKKEDTQSTGSGADTVILVETVTESISTPHVSVAFSKSHLKQLHNDIEELKHRVQELMELPSNLDLINASRDKSQPIVDMFQLLTLNKRITANEEGLTKMASMIEDLARETEGPVASGVQARKTSSVTAMQANINERIGEMEKLLGVQESATDDGKINLFNEVMNLKDLMNNLQQQLESAGVTTSIAGSSKAVVTGSGKGVSPTGATITDNATGGSGSVTAVNEQKSASQTETVPTKAMTNMVKKFEDCSNHIQSLDTMFRKEMSDVRDHVHNLEELVNIITEKLRVSCDTGSMSENSSTDMHNKLLQMQTDVENLVETANKLIADKENKDTTFSTILEEIELLKTIKADREDLEDALADKADACAVNRKVSHDQFDAACDDLSKGIENALEKLMRQESLWQRALDEIQKEISNKLDKSELLPLRDFINKKLKLLQDRLKDLTKLKKETEAAGVKSKYLKDVNCISCDKNVVMRKQIAPETMPKPYAMPPGKSIAPYLAYELDNLRKQQKCFPHGRNLNNFEKATNIPKGMEDHICNRYCGGSHTITTPQQRVTRLGHFVQQWGPGVLPVGESVVRGTDGQMYKSSDPSQLPQEPITPIYVQGERAASPRKSGEGDAPSITKERRQLKEKRPSSEKQPSKSSKGSLTKATSGDVRQASQTRRASAGSKRQSQQSVKSAHEKEQQEGEVIEIIQEQSEVENVALTEETTVAPSDVTESVEPGAEEALQTQDVIQPEEEILNPE